MPPLRRSSASTASIAILTGLTRLFIFRCAADRFWLCLSLRRCSGVSGRSGVFGVFHSLVNCGCGQEAFHTVLALLACASLCKSEHVPACGPLPCRRLQQPLMNTKVSSEHASLPPPPLWDGKVRISVPVFLGFKGGRSKWPFAEGRLEHWCSNRPSVCCLLS